LYIHSIYLFWRIVYGSSGKKRGNSLGIRIPNHIARELSLRDGSFVHINDVGKEIIIKPIQKNKLSELISKINEQNIHEEIKTGDPVGKEVW
jgi:antitoxin MazE